MYIWFNLDDMYVIYIYIYIYTHIWFNMEDMYMYKCICIYIHMTILCSWGETKPTDIT